MDFQRPDCKVQFGASEHIKVIPACMGGYALQGCAEPELCGGMTTGDHEIPVEQPSRVAPESVPRSNAGVIAKMGSSGYLSKLPGRPGA